MFTVLDVLDSNSVSNALVRKNYWPLFTVLMVTVRMEGWDVGCVLIISPQSKLWFLQDQSNASESKSLCCWCCASGPINGNLFTDRTCYVPGEYVVINGTINNGR